MLSTAPVRRLVSLTALLVLAAGGCGDDDDAPGRTATVASGTTLTVVGDEYSFDPETIVLTGGELTIELDNEGVLAHNLRVFDGETDVGGTPTFVGGDPRPGTVRVAPGEYELICTVGDHADLGMTGKLTVK